MSAPFAFVWRIALFVVACLPLLVHSAEEDSDPDWYGTQCTWICDPRNDQPFCVALDEDHKPDGTVITNSLVGRYRAGKRYGEWIAFRFRKQSAVREVAAVGRFVDGLEHGVFTSFWSPGVVECQAAYRRGVLLQYFCQGPSGTPWPRTPEELKRGGWGFDLFEL
jgi:hypothetical protein